MIITTALLWKEKRESGGASCMFIGDEMLGMKERKRRGMGKAWRYVTERKKHIMTGICKSGGEVITRSKSWIKETTVGKVT